MSVALKAIRERVREMASNPRLSELVLVDDRAQLLALVDRQTALLKDARADLARQFGEVGFSTVEDIDDLLHDLDGDARGGGPR